MEEQKIRFKVYSQALHLSERRYKDVGLRFHSLPLTFRENYMREHISASNVGAEFGIGFFGIPPDRIMKLQKLRTHRDNARSALSQDDPDTAKKEVDELRDLLNVVESQIQASGSSVKCMIEQYEKEPILDGENTAAQAMRKRDEWILLLPEVVKGLELGLIENEEQAIAGMIQCDEERIV